MRSTTQFALLLCLLPLKLVASPVIFLPAESQQRLRDPRDAARIGLGLSFEGSVPFGNAFSLVTNNQEQDFRFQAPVAPNLEFSYVLNSKYELGASLGWQHYGTRSVNSDNSLTRIESVEVTSLPQIKLLARHRKAISSFIAWENEGSLGLNVYRIESASTDASIAPREMTGFGLSTHLTTGVAFLWHAQTILSFGVGVGGQSLPNASWETNLFSLNNKSWMGGAFFKSQLKRYF